MEGGGGGEGAGRNRLSDEHRAALEAGSRDPETMT